MQSTESVTQKSKHHFSTAVRFILMLGVVSLFGDMTYEGARSIIGPYLAVLGASGTVVGLVAGAGELIGYVVRLFSGYISDRTGRYWSITIVGYVLNLFAVPLLALAGNWEIAVILIICERFGKAVRAPTRDAMLSHAASQTGAGWGFGLHEAMDTAGAILGPLIVSAVLYFGHDYSFGFGILVVPAIASLAVLLGARAVFPNPRALEAAGPVHKPKNLPRIFWIYCASAACIAAGYADFSLIAYHFGKAAIISPPVVPLFYAIAMIAAALAALGLGHLFDRKGIVVIIPAALVCACSAPLALLGGAELAILGVICWGVGMGVQESVMRAVVSQMIGRNRRGTAYGVFHSIFGASWFVGSALLGFLYDHSIIAVAAVSFGLQIASIPFLYVVVKSREAEEAGS
jgi:MFS family permease